jgi:hypothetical protein
MAVQAGNPASAKEHLQYLADNNRLTPNNLLFLRIHALAELGEWDQLLSTPELPDLLQMRRPIVVTEAILRAVYRRELQQFEEKQDVVGALDHFKDIVLPAYNGLFIRRTGMRAPEALKALMLYAIAGQATDPALRDSILEVSGISESDTMYLTLLAKRLPQTLIHHEPASLDSAVSARDRGDFEQAFAIAIEWPNSARRARLLIECAYELNTIDSAAIAVAAVTQLSEDAKQEALIGRRVLELYKLLLVDPDNVTQDKLLPTNWTEWIERVNEEPGWVGALDFARRGAREWKIEDLLSTSGAVESLISVLTKTGGGATLQNALPYLVSFLETDPVWPRPEFKDLYKTILALLAIGSEGSEDDIRVYIDIAQNVIALGIDSNTYRLMMSDLQHLLTTFATPSRIMWGIEALEMVATYPCADMEARMQLLIDVVSLTQKFRRRTDESRRTALRLLCHDLEAPDLANALNELPSHHEIGNKNVIDVLAQLNGKLLAIYTLTESAGRYMQQIVAERAPQASVKLSHDKVGTESLRHLAKGADIFIMATASATHAATGFIEANRPKERPILRPRGKGMASMLSALEEFLKREPIDTNFALAS